MDKFMNVGDLARDQRFIRVPMEARLNDPRGGNQAFTQGAMVPVSDDGPARAQALMHGIFVGEIQALEGAGRTAFDFADDPDTPYALKLDMARQCWDEARHCEISVKLLAHMGVELGEFSENTFLFEAACADDPVLRLCGVNRALEGLAIDVFNAMRDFGMSGEDPVMTLSEDWMLADEVTHVKMGSDWLRRITESDPERRTKALEFQRTVDRLFSFGGLRGENEDSAIHLARRFRELAGFTDAEIDEVAGLSDEAYQMAMERRKQMAQAAAPAPAAG
jgi:uncharacterized ferritin-like protein (DUF455 family)